ncbi:MAG: zinc ribbon domain-containing protein [Opitutaceae bacterium]|jgi:hypothetical protein|nr:zinc ribbon domain-containing protein [Opitutaceae bacterium]
MSRRPPPNCAICGAELSPNARACPNCGADERTGWDGQDVYDGLDLPGEEDTAEAYQRFLRNEMPGRAGRRKHHLVIVTVCLVVIIAMVMATLGLR